MINQLYNDNYWLVAEFMKVESFKKTEVVLLHVIKFIKCN
jgi:hypothetical protein